jgi:mannose-6-phosphate isomerase-like protein (cupin superfamily)
MVIINYLTINKYRDMLETGRLPDKYDHLAPDTSEIRILAYMKDGEMHLPPEDHGARVPLLMKGGLLGHCTFLPRKTSFAVMHQTVQEIWYFVQGKGQVWRKQGDTEETVVDVEPGTTLTIPTKAHFQFRNVGGDDEPLCFLIQTIPPWPGAQEAIRVEGKWH